MASIIENLFVRLWGQRQRKLEGRELHSVVAVRDSLYLWGGKIAGEDSCTLDQFENLLYCVQHFPLSTGKWTTRRTTGNPPRGFLGYSCSVAADKLYFFGGSMSFNQTFEFYNSITRLDSSNLKWKELQPNNPDIPVMRRSRSGIISFDSNGDHHLLMIGGVGFAPTVPIPNLGYLCDDDGRIDAKTIFHTNEHSLYNISSGHWCDPPAIIGECMEPCWGFVMEQICNNRAVVFGGKINNEEMRNDIYLLEISVKEIQWECLKQTGPLDLWPMKRIYGGATVIAGLHVPILVITGGINQNEEFINDFWIFNVDNHSWTKLTDVPQAFCERANCSLSAFVMNPHCVWLVTTGGNYTITFSETMIIELVNDNDQWKVGQVLDCTDKMYQSLYKSFHLLQISEKQQEIQRLTEDFRQRQNEMEREVQRCHQQLQQVERELEVNQEAWVVDKNEVIITEEELGKGSYGRVKVGIFRGLRVAVKSLHAIIISDYNLGRFTREMNIASRVRHPNLVQFIGATKVENPLILTELMTTSLNEELLKGKQLTEPQILGIAQDVALGLNYLHLFKPQPIIHRDISSPNVLLKVHNDGHKYEAKVADYGTANLQLNASTEMPGNAAYAAPEAPIPDQHSPAMDVYSYSVLIMEMSLHEPPEMTIVERENQATKVSSESLKSIIKKGLSFDKTNRPPMNKMIDDIAKLR